MIFVFFFRGQRWTEWQQLLHREKQLYGGSGANTNPFILTTIKHPYLRVTVTGTESVPLGWCVARITAGISTRRLSTIPTAAWNQVFYFKDILAVIPTYPYHTTNMLPISPKFSPPYHQNTTNILQTHTPNISNMNPTYEYCKKYWFRKYQTFLLAPA